MGRQRPLPLALRYSPEAVERLVGIPAHRIIVMNAILHAVPLGGVGSSLLSEWAETGSLAASRDRKYADQSDL